MTTYGVTVTPIGKARQGYRVQTRTGSFDVRTTSAKRYLVVDLRSGTIAKRTNDRDTARRMARRIDAIRGVENGLVIDRRIVDATSGGLLDLGGAL